MKLKTILLILTLSLTTLEGFSQVFASYHQSSIPFAGIGYEFRRFAPELRVGTNVFVDDISAEFVLPYKVISREDYYIDAGLGVRYNVFRGLVLPVGFTAFPFQKKGLGFHAELALISDFESSAILRGSWGIAYRFGRQNSVPVE
ncbi:hypothetical protein ABID22_004105 [Pontibacter aydingkolensis]|uniref:Outer membrane protein beta-barrel domain-containing protein n=1 Tax=Pontibacter aydingkolensis TaxID=1911536 RepID=A0ABS7CZT4_9BACT|nr:hypothetical protein [Pontibacter aydingkolensis]MBW7469337.1 hypothetical protein [Pontibacter aydingkolensis]